MLIDSPERPSASNLSTGYDFQRAAAVCVWSCSSCSKCKDSNIRSDNRGVGRVRYLLLTMSVQQRDQSDGGQSGVKAVMDDLTDLQHLITSILAKPTSVTPPGSSGRPISSGGGGGGVLMGVNGTPPLHTTQLSDRPASASAAATLREEIDASAAVGGPSPRQWTSETL